MTIKNGFPTAVADAAQEVLAAFNAAVPYAQMGPDLFGVRGVGRQGSGDPFQMNPWGGSRDTLDRSSQ